jgi:hypothetical protein
MSTVRSFPAAVLLAIALLPALPRAASADGFEAPPVLQAKGAATAALLSGRGFRVDPRVPTNGLTTEFTIQSDVGTFPALGAETLALRESEIPALLQLDRDSKAAIFANAVGTTAMKPLKSAAQMLTSPVETVQGLPEGLGRFFDRVEAGAEKLGAAVTNSNTDVAANGDSVAEMAGGITANALGYNLELRQLAKKLGVDPYTSNPVLAEKLGEFAQVAFVGHVATNTLISVAVPASLAITATNVTRDLVYDTPAADLIVKITTNLQAMGIADDVIRAFQQAPGFTLSMRTDFVDTLQKLAGVTGRSDVVALAATVKTADQGLFLVRALRMLVRYQQDVAPLAALTARGTVIATDANGALFVPAPVDYVSWTERVSRFAQRDDLTAPKRSVWLSGRMTPRAKAEFEALGWSVRERATSRP